MGMMRAVLDAKYNEYLFINKSFDIMTKLSRFSDFLYTFLSLYTIENKSRKIKLSNNDEN